MKFFRRTVAAPCAHQSSIERLYAEQTRQREQAAQERADLIARLTTRYYAASALVADSHAQGIVGTNGHQIGVCSGLIDALAEATGINSITVAFRLSHGIPVTETTWVAVNDHPDMRGSDIRILHDGIREPIAERLDRLHRDALKATGHPMYQVLYGKHAA